MHIASAIGRISARYQPYLTARDDALRNFNRRQWLTIGATAASGLSPRAAAAKPGRNRIRLSLNENPFGPSPYALEAIQAQLADLSRYSGEEVTELTNIIAERENIAAEQIVLGEILDVLGLYLSTNGGPGGQFIYSELGYTALVNAVAPAGGVVVSVPLNERLENDLPAIAGKINAHTRAIYLVNPHNPTGTVSDAAQFIAFVRDHSKHALVIVDEAYLEFASDFDRRTVAGLVRSGEQVAVFRTFSKIYGLAGLAIGYTLAPRTFAASLKQLGIGAFYGLNRLSLVAASASLKDPTYIATTRDKVATERNAWHDLFRTSNVRFAESRGNFVFFDSGHPHRVIAEALAAQGIEIGRAYPPLDTWVRISIGLPEDNMIARQVVAALLPAP